MSEMQRFLRIDKDLVVNIDNLHSCREDFDDKENPKLTLNFENMRHSVSLIGDSEKFVRDCYGNLIENVNNPNTESYVIKHGHHFIHLPGGESINSRAILYIIWRPAKSEEDSAGFRVGVSNSHERQFKSSDLMDDFFQRLLDPFAKLHFKV